MKKILVYLLTVLSIFSFTGCSQDKDVPSETKTINIGVMPDVESIPFIIAEKNGYFEQEGVQVNIVHFKSAKDRDSALQSGQLDGVITDVLAVVFANEGGFDLKIVARNEGNVQLLAGKDSALQSIADIKGKSIGLSTNTIMDYTADKMLEAGKLSPDQVEKVAIPQLPTRLEMLQNSKIDAAILPQPLCDLAVQNGARVLASTDELRNKAGAIAFTGTSLEKNLSDIKAVMRGYNAGAAYIQEQPLEDYVDYLIEEQGFPAEVKDSIKLPQYTNAQLPDEAIVADVVAWMKAREAIKTDYQYKDLINDEVIR